GSGSRFWLKIKAPPARLAPAAAEKGAAPKIPLAGTRVLVADDNAVNRELIRIYLLGIGAELTEAVDGEEAVRLAMELPYDVILMDMRMPKLNGVEALQQIRTTGGPNDAAPILAFTAEADPSSEQRILALGFSAVVAKPIEPEALIKAIAQAVG